MTIKTENGSVISTSSDEFIGYLDSVSIGFVTSEEIELVGTFNNEDFQIDAQQLIEKIVDCHEDETDEIKFSEKGTLMYGME